MTNKEVVNLLTSEDKNVLTVTPESVDAAPTIAYKPGMTQLRSPLHDAKIGLLGCEFCIHWTRMPSIRPAHAPTIILVNT